MIEKTAEEIANMQIKYPKVFVSIFIILAILAAPGILKLVDNVEPSIEKVLPSDIEEIKTMNEMRAEFGADMMYILISADNPIFDVRNPDLIKYIDLLSQRLESHELIIQSRSVADIVKKENKGTIPADQKLINKILDENALMTQQYLNPDKSFTVIRLKTDTGSSAKQINTIIDDIKTDIENLEEHNPGSRSDITGFNAIDKATFEVIISDFGKITLLSMALVMTIVFLTFRSFAKGFLPMVVVMNALIWTMGITGYLGFTITVVSMVSAAMIMGLGIDFGIHVVHSYNEERQTKGPKKALHEVLRQLLRAMIAASLTTIAGFLALLFGVLPAMKVLGIILAIGILSTLIGAIFLLPPLVYMQDKWRNPHNA